MKFIATTPEDYVRKAVGIASLGTKELRALKAQVYSSAQASIFSVDTLRSVSDEWRRLLLRLGRDPPLDRLRES